MLGHRPFSARPFGDEGGNALSARSSRLGSRFKTKRERAQFSAVAQRPVSKWESGKKQGGSGGRAGLSPHPAGREKPALRCLSKLCCKMMLSELSIFVSHGNSSAPQAPVRSRGLCGAGGCAEPGAVRPQTRTPGLRAQERSLTLLIRG